MSQPTQSTQPMQPTQPTQLTPQAKAQPPPAHVPHVHYQEHPDGGWWEESGTPRDQHHRSKSSTNSTANKIAKIIVAILLPPLGVLLETGCDQNLLINALLTLLGYIPGIIHALYVILVD